MTYAKRINSEWKFAQVYGAGEVAEAQIAILAAQGYKPVRESERPANTPFIIWSARYTDYPEYVEEVYWPSPLIIHLDRAKLIGAAAAGGWLDGAMAYFQSSQAAQDWWANSLNYVEGSPMAEAAMAALGLTLEQVHALVLQCRE